MNMLLPLSALFVPAGALVQSYNTSWASLDSRPEPAWWGKQKFGVSLHWGVYSVPAWSQPTTGGLAEWYWHNMGGPSGPDNGATGTFHKRVYGADFTYQDFAPEFRAELYNASEWANLFRECGVKVAVLTSKHHDGFELWPSARSFGWNSADIGPRQDLVGSFVTAMRAAGIHAGLYHSVFEWYNPLYRGPKPEDYVTEKLIPDLHDIVEKYKPDMLLMDGEWEQTSDFWQTRPFLQWLFNDSPVKDTVVVDDRWGSETRGKHGGVYVCENGMFSPFCDGTGAAQGATHSWLYWATQAKSWGFSRTEDDTDYRDAAFFVPVLVRAVADGGALMLNIGPSADGRIPAMQQSVLRGIGTWLGVNGDAIYNTTARQGGLARHETSNLRNTFSPLMAGTNLFYDKINPKQDSATARYLGVADNASECESLCVASADTCYGFTWHDDATGDYARMCYGSNVTALAITREADHFSAIRDFVQVHYTASGSKVLNAIVHPYPSGKLTLRSVEYRTGMRVTLLGNPAPPTNGTLGHWAGDGGALVIQVPQLPVNKMPCDHAYTFVVTSN